MMIMNLNVLFVYFVEVILLLKKRNHFLLFLLNNLVKIYLLFLLYSFAQVLASISIHEVLMKILIAFIKLKKRKRKRKTHIHTHRSSKQKNQIRKFCSEKD